jgi:hypothetical protein
MPRLLAVLLLALSCWTSACRRDAADDPEPAGPLEGTWRVGLTDAVEYDTQNNVAATFTPAAGILGFTRLRFTPTTVEKFDVTLTNWAPADAYTRTGNELQCQLPAWSYTIRKLTARHLDLYYRGEYPPPGSHRPTRLDYTIHLDRE